jgi:O-glycosyl hydrolase
VARSGITINAAKHYQRIAGFGVSEGFGQAKTLMNAPASVQKQVLSLLYSPTGGAGLTILRNEISADAGFTIEPKAPNSPTAKPSYLSLAEATRIKGSCGSRSRSRPTMAPACSPMRGALPRS